MLFELRLHLVPFLVLALHCEEKDPEDPEGLGVEYVLVFDLSVFFAHTPQVPPAPHHLHALQLLQAMQGLLPVQRARKWSVDVSFLERKLTQAMVNKSKVSTIRIMRIFQNIKINL